MLNAIHLEMIGRLEDKSNACKPCVDLGKLVGQEVEAKTKSVVWAVVAATSVTIGCAFALELLDEWLRSLKEPKH